MMITTIKAIAMSIFIESCVRVFHTYSYTYIVYPIFIRSLLAAYEQMKWIRWLTNTSHYICVRVRALVRWHGSKQATNQLNWYSNNAQRLPWGLAKHLFGHINMINYEIFKSQKNPSFRWHGCISGTRFIFIAMWSLFLIFDMFCYFLTNSARCTSVTAFSMPPHTSMFHRLHKFHSAEAKNFSKSLPIDSQHSNRQFVNIRHRK